MPVKISKISTRLSLFVPLIGPNARNQKRAKQPECEHNQNSGYNLHVHFLLGHTRTRYFRGLPT
jgi:hypothetical protein